MFKSWFDRIDTWQSVMDNSHNAIRLEWFHDCCAFHFPDMLTVGMGGLTQGESRVEFFLWTVLASPIILSADIRKLDAFVVDLVTNDELLAVIADKDCAQGSLVKAWDATEVWIRSLSDGTFVVVLINKDSVNKQQAQVDFTDWWGTGDFFPADFQKGMRVRDL